MGGVKGFVSKFRQTTTAPEEETEDQKELASYPRWMRIIQFVVGGLWIVFQGYIVLNPLVPMLQRPVHVMFAVSIAYLFKPMMKKGRLLWLTRVIDLVCAALPLIIAYYFYANEHRILTRIVMISPVFTLDYVFCILLVILLLEATRRTVGWSLFGVVLAFLIYGAFGFLFPGWLRFDGIQTSNYVELLFLGDSGIFGIPAETSLLYVFYFVLFGAVYTAIGGSRLLVEVGHRITRKQKGGAAKAAIVASSLMGTVSGSAVANVTTVGVFTIPFMRRSGYDRETAGAIEAIASTGGQLMPPVMGIGAFVMAELLGLPYIRIALAGLIPALLFYISIFLLIDFKARREGIGVSQAPQKQVEFPILPNIHLFIPLAVVVFMIVLGFTPTLAAVLGTLSAIAVSFVGKSSRLSWSRVFNIVRAVGRQAASVAVPIAIIGIIIAVAVQSNLALKFSNGLVHISGGSLILSFVFIILGCIILGMGLPTVAAYIMAAIFFVPPLMKFGITVLSAHFFVFYYSILAMVTPPVALASFTAAGIAHSDVTKTGVRAFIMSFVAFMIPFAFIYNPALLFSKPIFVILAKFAAALVGIIGWAGAIAGFVGKKIPLYQRLLLGLFSLGILIINNNTVTLVSLGLTILDILWINVAAPRLAKPHRAEDSC